ncbi:MAG: PD40 domain-containing protein [Acidobacteriota bacterium]|nr:PD40 domain-containing protein [Acidobacteriota bacterium]
MIYRFGPFLFDSDQELLFKSERFVPLNQKALRVLRLLLVDHGCLVPKDKLMREVWADTFVEENNLTQAIGTLRRTFGDNRNGSTFIQTVFKRGFCFVAPVTIEELPASSSKGDMQPDGFTVSDSGVLPSSADNALTGSGWKIADSERSGDHLAQDSDIGQTSTSFATPALNRPNGNMPGDRNGSSPGTADSRLAGEHSAHQSPPVAPTERNTKLLRYPQGNFLRGIVADSHFVRFSMKAALIAGLALVVYFVGRWMMTRSTPVISGFTQLTYDGRKKSDGAPLLTDGRQVYFWEYRGDGLVLASAPVDGGEVTEVHVPPGFVTSDVSKGGSELLGCGRAPDGVVSLATVSASAKSLLWFTQIRGPASDPPWACQAVWSPDQKLISSSVLNGVIKVGLDSGSIRQIADVDGRPTWPRWSPNGRKLVFSVLKPKAETFSLWQVNADGSFLHRLSFPGSGFTEVRCGSWTPNGKFLLFEAEQSGRRDIWAVQETGQPWSDTPKAVRLTLGPLNYFWPVASPDGTEIFVLGEENRGELMRFDLKSHSFAEFLGGISAAEVAFSRDRKWVAYVTYPDYTLWCARADGSDAHQLTYPPLEAREPHWSPDGRQIAFQGISHRDHYKIYIVPSDGGAVREAMTGSGEQSVGTWWPDGRGLLYDEPLYRHDPSQMFLHRLDLSTGKTSRIPGSGGSWTARLSPDGRYIATLDAAPMADSRHLFILEAATGRRVFSLTMSEAIHEPTWSRDGQYVYFATLDPPAPALYRVRTRDKKLERLVSLKGFPVAGLWTGVAPDGSPLLLRDTSIEEIYALHVRWP